MIKNNLLLKNFILLFIILCSAACGTARHPAVKNKDLYQDFISAPDTKYYYAKKIIDQIPEAEKYPAYNYFKIMLSLKTEPFSRNLETITNTDDQKAKIKGFIEGATKYLSLQRPELSKKFLFLAEKELYSLIKSEKKLSYETAILFTYLLNSALNLEDYSVFEKICSGIISKSRTHFFRPYQLRPLMVPVKKYIIRSFKENRKYSKKILFFAESIAWEMQPEKKADIPELELKPYQTDISMPAFFNPERLKAISLIQLAEIYSNINQPEEIQPIYNELVKIWKNSIEKPQLGKSFGLYIPQFVKILFKEDYRREAMIFISLIPEVYPYFISTSSNIKRPSLAFHKFKLREYNKQAADHKYRCFRNIVFIIHLDKGPKASTEWINANIEDKNLKIKLFSDISYIERHKNKKTIDQIVNLTTDFPGDEINAEIIKTIYLPVIFNLSLSDQKKAEELINLLSDKINMLPEEEKILLYMKLSKSIRKLTPQKSMNICNQSFSAFFSLDEDDPIEKLSLLQKIMVLSSDRANQCFSTENYIKYSQKLIDKISVPGNPDRTYEVKIDSLIFTARSLNYFKKNKESLIFLDQAKTFIELLGNKELKNSYTFSLFMRYAKSESYKSAYETFKMLNLENFDKDDFIIQITKLFITNDIKKNRWLLYDINNDGIDDFINPEASEKLQKSHLTRLRN